MRLGCRPADTQYTGWQNPWDGAMEAGQLAMRGGLRRGTDESLCPAAMAGVGLYGRGPVC